MPYIDDRSRERLVPVIEAMETTLATPGDAAYIIAELTRLLVERLQGGETYAGLAMIDGILGSAHAEWRRRVLFPYEDDKMEENGDVY